MKGDDVRKVLNLLSNEILVIIILLHSDICMHAVCVCVCDRHLCVCVMETAHVCCDGHLCMRVYVTASVGRRST